MLTGPTHGRKGRDAPTKMANTRDTVRAPLLATFRVLSFPRHVFLARNSRHETAGRLCEDPDER
jgi:hypothetical protein